MRNSNAPLTCANVVSSLLLFYAWFRVGLVPLWSRGAQATPNRPIPSWGSGAGITGRRRYATA